jgi:hypothetical protein
MTRSHRSGKGSTRVADVIAEKGFSLGSLMKQGSFLMQLHHLLSGFLDPSLAAHFQVAAVRDGKLVLIAPSASWATRLRMHAPSLLESLHGAGFTELKSIQVRVAPLAKPPVEKRRKRELTAAAKQALDAMSRLESDPEKKP